MVIKKAMLFSIIDDKKHEYRIFGFTGKENADQILKQLKDLDVEVIKS